MGARACALTVLALMAAPATALGAWTQPVAAPLNIGTRTASLPSIAALGGSPIVAWSEDNGSANQIYVSQLAGAAWSELGGSLNVDAAQRADAPSIAILGGVPDVAWSEQDANSGIFQIRVKGFSGGAWSSIGGSVNIDVAHGAFSPSSASFGTAINPSLWVAFTEDNGSGLQLVHVRQHLTLGWTTVGGTLGDQTK